MKFVFNTATQNLNDGTKPHVISSDPEQITTLIPGRYKVVDAGLICEPAILDQAQVTFSRFGPPRFICQFPMNSCVILDTSKV